MTREYCKKIINHFLDDGHIESTIDQIIASKYVGDMLNDTTIDQFIPRAVIGVAFKRLFDTQRSASQVGKRIEEDIIEKLSM